MRYEFDRRHFGLEWIIPLLKETWLKVFVFVELRQLITVISLVCQVSVKSLDERARVPKQVYYSDCFVFFHHVMLSWTHFKSRILTKAIAFKIQFRCASVMFTDWILEPFVDFPLQKLLFCSYFVLKFLLFVQIPYLHLIWQDLVLLHECWTRKIL